MNRPTPAIVAQDAVRRLPRWALMLFCIAYVVPGLVGRAPWNSADISAFGYMLAMARGETSWMDPTLVGMRPEADGLLPYWLGAAAIRAMDGWMDHALAARLPFFALLGLALAAGVHRINGFDRGARLENGGINANFLSDGSHGVKTDHG